MLRNMKIALIFSVALWGIVGASGNVMDWGGTMGAVGAATSMATFDGGAESWKAATNPALIWAGALFIMLSKIIAGILCLIGASKMLTARKSDAAIFAKAKELALAGCAVAVFMLFTGFVVIAETWFELWRSDVMRGPVLDSAFRYGGMISLIAIFVAAREE